MLANSSANTSTNSSDLPCPDYRTTHRLHMVVYSLVLLAALPLNALALWVFLRALRVHSVVSVYMCNLAASDLLFTLSLPVRLPYYVLHHWPFPDLLCQTAGAIFQMNMYGSCIFLTLINVDRYAAVVHPLRLRHLRRPRVARLLCLGVWALILVFAVPTMLVHKPSSCSYRGKQVRLVLMVMVLLAGANCVLDPLVYYFSAEGFRNTLRGLGSPLGTRTSATNGDGGTLAQLPQGTTRASGPAASSQGLIRHSYPRTPIPEDSVL
ncbi:PREDICTED: lysophosphatidic acid receptor 5 [Myotis davidii]|uniref:lysophosphatidic acid receptor 5 n=1 Tax=Myotis davidii TaxID=225400 RepID=UPI000767A28B|nr:PREDICTED: lysophosphatidic acid receptor 5 [Myotis davidii]